MSLLKDDEASQWHVPVPVSLEKNKLPVCRENLVAGNDKCSPGDEVLHPAMIGKWILPTVILEEIPEPQKRSWSGLTPET